MKQLGTRVDINRPSWIEFYMGQAFAWAKRSHDAETKHGCIITTANNRIIGAGYNGFPPNIDDTDLPNIRPYKYPWMRHSERNALDNCTASPVGGKAYVTGKCCNDCLEYLIAAGIREIYMADKHGWHNKDAESEKIWDELAARSRIVIQFVQPKLSWLKELGEEVVQENFYSH